MASKRVRIMGIAAAIGLFLIIPFAIGHQAEATEGKYTPVFGKGQHTVWDEDRDDFGNTYSYNATPTDYGWFTGVVAGSDYSSLVFACYYDEESDSTAMAVRFLLDNQMPFSEDEVSLTITIGEYEAAEVTFFRREDEPHIVESLVAGFDKSRLSETFTVGIGPFTFNHDIEKLFDVPVASNLLWCDDREVAVESE